MRFWSPVLAAALAVAPAAAAPPVDPVAASADVAGMLKDARADDAMGAVGKYLEGVGAPAQSFAAARSALDTVTHAGPADVLDTIEDKTFGTSVRIVIDYLHFPHAETSVNRFLFVRFTYMKNGDGWGMTDFTFATSGVYPPKGWPAPGL